MELEWNKENDMTKPKISAFMDKLVPRYSHKRAVTGNTAKEMACYLLGYDNKGRPHDHHEEFAQYFAGFDWHNTTAVRSWTITNHQLSTRYELIVWCRPVSSCYGPWVAPWRRSAPLSTP